MIRRNLIFAVALPALLAISACSNDNAPGPGDGGDGGSGADAGNSDAGNSDAGSSDAGNSDAGNSDAGVACVPSTPFGGGEASVAATSVSALIIDETGAPMPGQPLYICGLDICSSPATTTDAGVASISTTLTEKKPAFKYGDALNYAEFAIPLGAGATDFTSTGTGKLGTAKLAGKPGEALTPGSDAVSGDVTVSLAADAVIGIDDLVYGTADQQKFRAVSVPINNLGPAVGGVTISPGVAASFALVYGVAPSETTLCPAAKVTVALPANLGWAAGAGVEFWITTLDTAQTYAPYAGWTKMSDGTVSADGTSASTSTGQGFTVLENFAVRLK